jgi:hypothetical protein
MWSSSAVRSNRCDTLKTVPRPPAQHGHRRYSALMRLTKHMQFLLTSVLVASVAFAQTAQTKDRQAADSAPAGDAIAAARNQYTQATGVSSDADNNTLAQFPRGGPGRPFPPQRRYPSERYQTPWMDHGGAGPVVIGAAIGFAIGAALGANQSAHNGTPVSGGIIVGGGLLGFIGGCVGKAAGTFPGVHYSSLHRRKEYRPSWPEGDEEGSLRSHTNSGEGYAEASASPKFVPSQPHGVEAIAIAMPAVPYNLPPDHYHSELPTHSSSVATTH